MKRHRLAQVSLFFLAILLLLAWDRPLHAAIIVVLLGVQLVLMLRLLRDPRRHAPWYNATGTTLYVLGMLVCAFALLAGKAGA